jgi:uncharacterized protein (TIGR02145 family)
MKRLSVLILLFFGLVGMGAAQTVTIGNQVWMTKNLNVSTFRNGDAIPEAKTAEEWIKAGENKQPAWCYYDNDPANGEKYGKLYNWYAVNEPRGLAPEGWHVPSYGEMTKLIDYLGGEAVAGSKLKSSYGWRKHRNGKDQNGNDSSGFTGLPGGLISRHLGEFYDITEIGIWWTSSSDREVNKEFYTDGAFDFELGDNSNTIFRSVRFKNNGFSVRCLKD